MRTNHKNDNIVEHDYYRWLEENSSNRRNWLKTQSERTNQYMENEVNAKITKYWEKNLQESFTDNVPLMSYNLGNNRKILLLPKNKDDLKEVVLEEDGIITKRFLKNSNNSSRRSSIPVIWLDLKKEHVIIPVFYNGSFDVSTIYIYNIHSGKKIAKLDNVHMTRTDEPFKNPLVWLNPSEFTYEKFLGANFITLRKQLGEKRVEFENKTELYLSNSPKINFVYKTVRSKTYIKGINDTKYVDVGFKFQKIEAEADRFLYVIKKENRLGQVISNRI